MGEVYRAKDTRLGREVAIKVLPEEVAQDAELLKRFEREARLLASLNHPNIATLHGFEAEGATNFLVMELVEGETLSDRITRGPVPVEEAIPLFLQIAEGLEAAHDKGVIHRDLKPGNVKVSGEGHVKVLDFGLAKAMVAEATSDGSDSQLPTVPMAATRKGQILGTPAYMSPEQARGLSVEKRSDIWAFGVCLYEALTGKAAFDGETATDILVGILEREPAWQALPTDTPETVRVLLRRCLEKAVKERLHDIGDARLELRDAVPASTVGPRSAEPDGVPRRPRRALVAGTAVVLAAILAVAAWNIRKSSETAVQGSGYPVVVLMDTPAPAGVYDEDTRRESGTNADDLNDALGDLPVVLHKETVGATWDREDQVLRQQPDLIVIHRSGFVHSINAEFGLGYPPFDEVAENGTTDVEVSLEKRYGLLEAIGVDKLWAFLGYIGLGDPGTRFLVYSRGHGGPWSQSAYRQDWVTDLERRFPSLRGRIFTMDVPVGPDGASFRESATSELARGHVKSILGLEELQSLVRTD